MNRLSDYFFTAARFVVRYCLLITLFALVEHRYSVDDEHASAELTLQRGCYQALKEGKKETIYKKAA